MILKGSGLNERRIPIVNFVQSSTMQCFMQEGSLRIGVGVVGRIGHYARENRPMTDCQMNTSLEMRRIVSTGPSPHSHDHNHVG